MLTEDAIVDINERYYNIALRNYDADIAIARAIESAAAAPLLEEIERLKQRCAELEKQMESQKDTWLSWEAKRKHLEKNSARYEFIVSACEVFHDGKEIGSTSELDSAMSGQEKA